MKQKISKITGALILAAGFWLAIIGCRKEHNPPPADVIPGILKVPEGNRKLWDGYAKGYQIYQVQRSTNDPGVLSWVNIAPSAKLYGKPDYTNELAIHYAGPTWKQTKDPNNGNTVVGKKIQGVIQNVNAIQWLLLKAVDSLSSPDNKITFIQRLYTVGGLAPTTGADETHLGMLDSIPYTATYSFYEANR
jgi:hypothetical protein